ncbi:ABC transporter substrate-binding protein [Acidovorax sp. Be4]|uniref:ABC transporter substrate-binding protein n=1 Tax=Acidovorax bellezanensis TaxID=2976702 RepID=A0ABT2PIW9_9BURK|nr:ABC transporter substrate-binding protein [Acidovorax sp. Be4]MCT9810426.1 ABC transporter substrate-binding protein [Acidovorax sp. Be4]
MLLKLLFSSLLAAGLLTAGGVQAETVRWARASDPTTLDPHAFNVGTNFVLLHQMYEPLVIRDAKGKLVPTLATSWKLTADPTVWEFKLRPNVKFHDGAPLTAKDVVFSLNRAKGPTAQVKSLLASMESATAVDELTVHVKTKGPNLIFPDNLTNMFIMNEAWAKAKGAETTQDTTSTTENFSTRNANGTGPYQLVSREQDAKTVMKLNPQYWGKGQVPLQVTELVYLPIKSPATRVAALLSGEVDFAQDIPAQDVARLKQDARLRINEGPENRSIFLGLNVGGKELKYSSLKGKNPLADPRVREAIHLAIDRDAIKRSVMRGLSIPSGIIAPSFVNGYTKAMAAYPKVDVAKAKQLLADAGYANGFDLTLHSTNDRYVNDEAISTAVAGFLGRVGIKTNVVARPIAQHSVAINNADADFYLFGWGVPTYDSAYIFDFLVYTRGKDGRGPTNATGFSSPEVDTNIAALASESDKAKRDQTIQRIWDVVQKERFYIPLHDQVIHFASIKRIDVPVHPDNAVQFKDVKFSAK